VVVEVQLQQDNLVLVVVEEELVKPILLQMVQLQFITQVVAQVVEVIQYLLGNQHQVDKEVEETMVLLVALKQVKQIKVVEEVVHLLQVNLH
jgi:hypothetical protein